jgi:hypothetical protein
LQNCWLWCARVFEQANILPNICTLLNNPKHRRMLESLTTPNSLQGGLPSAISITVQPKLQISTATP